VQALQIAAGVAAAMGGEVPVPLWEQEVAAFNADLASPPASEQPKSMTVRDIKLRALR